MSPTREKLPGYRHGLDVYEVLSCPQNESSWRTSARNLGCTLEIRNPATDLYYCIPNKSKTRLVEFCYDRHSAGTIKGVCQELDTKGILQDYDCKRFIQGCPAQPYLTETIYKYPSCLRINTEQRCYLAEEDCPPLSSVTTDSQISTTSVSSNGSTSKLTTLPVNFTESPFTDGSIITPSPDRDFSNLTKSPLWTSSRKFTSSTFPSDQTNYDVNPGVVIFSVFLAFLALVLAAVILNQKKRKRIYQPDTDEETVLIGVDDKQNESIVPDIHIDRNINVVFGQRTVINGMVTWSQNTDSTTNLSQDDHMVRWIRVNDSLSTQIDIQNEKYTGTSCDSRHPVLVINNTNFNDNGIYQLQINDKSKEIQLRVTGEKPHVSSGGFKVVDGEIVIDCKAILAPDSPKITLVRWTRDGNVIDTSVTQDKYSGGSHNNPSLTIKFLETSDIANYQCCVHNDVGETKSPIFYLDQIWTLPKEVQLVLFSLLLQENFQVNVKEDNLVLPWQSPGCEIQTKEELKDIFNGFKKNLHPYIDERNSFFQIRLDKRNELVLSFMKNHDFVDIFIKKACKENLKKYCRTPTYKAKDGEVCFNLETQQADIFIERLQYDILTHETMDDFESHSLIANKLKVPIEIIQRGKKCIQEYLQQLEKGKVGVFHAQGMIVGCAGAGKTTLLKKLKNLPFEDIRKSESTRGVDIQSDVFSVAEDKLSVMSEKIPTHFNIHHSKIASNTERRKPPNKEKSNHYLNPHLNTSIFPTTALSDVESEKDATDVQFGAKQLKSDMVDNKVKDVLTNTSMETHVKNISAMETHVVDISGQLDIPSKQHNLESIQVLSCLSEIKKEIPKTITFFDFAGQLAYYVTHQMHLSPRAFYMLVIDMTKNLDSLVEEDGYFPRTYKDIIRHWLFMIHAICYSKTPIILIATHAEGKSEQDIQSYFLDIWDLIHGHLHHNLLDPERKFAVGLESSIEDIESCIVNTVQKMDTWGEEMPSSWVMFEVYLRRIKATTKVIKTVDLLNENEKLDENVQLKQGDMKSMLQFFHDTGEILYFDEDFLNEYIILDVSWFVEAFKHIITDPIHAAKDLKNFKGSQYTALQTLKTNGVLTAGLVSAIWKINKDTYESCNLHMDEVMRYMERLGMLSKLTTTPEVMWYVPCLNQIPFSSEEFKDFNVSSILCFKFTFLPASVYYRLIATCLSQLSYTIPKWPKPEYFYKNAVLLHQDIFEHKYYVLVGHNEFQNTVELQILSHKGADVNMKKSDLLKQDITVHLNRLMKTFRTNFGSFTIGYRCRNSIFSEEPIAHFIPESEFTGKTIICKGCNLKKTIDVEKTLCYWNQKNTDENKSEKSSGIIHISNTVKDTHEGDVITIEDPTFTLETQVHMKEFESCRHISCVSSELAWVSDDDGTLILVNRLGEIIREISGKQTLRLGSHTTTKNGDFLFIESNYEQIFRVAEEQPTLFHHNQEYKMLCLFSSPINGDLLIGGQYHDQQGVVRRCDALGERYLQNIQVDDAGLNLYKMPRFITENINGDVIVSDYNKEGIVVVERSGKHRFTYRGRPPKFRFRPRGVCTDSLGRILACDPSSKSVHFLTMEGQYMFNLPTSKEGITVPYSVCMDNMERLWVVDDHTNKILIYRSPSRQ